MPSSAETGCAAKLLLSFDSTAKKLISIPKERFMQDQQDIQNVKTWQAPELIEIGSIASETQSGSHGGNLDGPFSSTS
jgi:hypothetical protein